MEIVNHVQAPENINRNLMTLPAQAVGVNNLANSATFQRLGMKTSQAGIPNLKVSHLETKPLSPVDIEENNEGDIQEEELEKGDNLPSEKTRFMSMKKVLSPGSAEVLARRDSVRQSKMGSQRMSRRTLKFQSPIDNEHGGEGADPGMLLSLPEDSKRSGRHRVEIGNDTVSWSLEPGGVSSKSEDEVVANAVAKNSRCILN